MLQSTGRYYHQYYKAHLACLLLLQPLVSAEQPHPEQHGRRSVSQLTQRIGSGSPIWSCVIAVSISLPSFAQPWQCTHWTNRLFASSDIGVAAVQSAPQKAISALHKVVGTHEHQTMAGCEATVPSIAGMLT